ncbi:GAF protein [Coleophoma crateriformis]|uniref:GAF protein n=1 Tax=Coleophoma crateriformis TaxID=565419 RepID=A0A3D8QLQ8_9HELO|nr:GAF protein [Coleophoma crateriformis]
MADSVLDSFVCQVHADASTFADGITKEEAYAQVLDQAEALFDGQRNWVRRALKGGGSGNLANTASLLWHAYKSLPAPAVEVNWAGFYVLDPKVPNQLILGPFSGQVACQTIRFNRGVCGAAAATKTTQLVPDVEKFPGHIACDGASQSEIVIPILVDGDVKAIIDVDCAVKDGFDEVDRLWLEKLAKLLGSACDW